MFALVDHIGIYVNDMEKEMRAYEEKFGHKATAVETHPNLGIKLCFIPVGEVMIELIQPITDDCNAARQLKAKGPHIGHVAYRVKDINKALADLKTKGVKAKNVPPSPGGAGSLISFLETEDTGGISIELVQREKW